MEELRHALVRRAERGAAPDRLARRPQHAEEITDVVVGVRQRRHLHERRSEGHVPDRSDRARSGRGSTTKAHASEDSRTVLTPAFGSLQGTRRYTKVPSGVACVRLRCAATLATWKTASG
jgi:hypothetical protein